MPALFLQFQAVAQSLLRVTRLAMSCSITDAGGVAAGERVTPEHTGFSFSGYSEVRCTHKATRETDT